MNASENNICEHFQWRNVYICVSNYILTLGYLYRATSSFGSCPEILHKGFPDEPYCFCDYKEYFHSRFHGHWKQQIGITTSRNSKWPSAKCPSNQCFWKWMRFIAGEKFSDFINIFKLFIWRTVLSGVFYKKCESM